MQLTMRSISASRQTSASASVNLLVAAVLFHDRIHCQQVSNFADIIDPSQHLTDHVNTRYRNRFRFFSVMTLRIKVPRLS